MFPPVFKTLSTTAVTAIVGTRIGRHGEVAQDEVRPYIVWQIVTGQPYDNLSAAPCGDFTVVQIDCYHQTDAGVEQLATAVRAALDRVNQDLSVIEKVRQFTFADEAFTIDNEELTPKQSIRRHKLKARYGDRLDGLYKG